MDKKVLDLLDELCGVENHEEMTLDFSEEHSGGDLCGGQEDREERQGELEKIENTKDILYDITPEKENDIPVKEEAAPLSSTGKSPVRTLFKQKSLYKYMLKNRLAIFWRYLVTDLGMKDKHEIIEGTREGYNELGKGGRYYNIPEAKKERAQQNALLDKALELFCKDKQAVS